MSNHGELRYFFYQSKVNAKQARWLTLNSESYFEIEYIKGKENKVADALNKIL